MTLEQFTEKRSRSLAEVPSVRVSKSYSSVRRQGEPRTGEDISFPTLTVRDPNELFTGNKVPGSLASGLTTGIDLYFTLQKEKSADSTSATPRPVFRPNVLEIAEEIKKINEIEANKIDATEEILAEVEAEAEAEEMINEIVDVMAEEILAEELAEEIKEITNVAAAEMVAEEIIEDIESLEEELAEDIDVSDIEIIEGSGFANIDFGAITEVTI